MSTFGWSFEAPKLDSKRVEKKQSSAKPLHNPNHKGALAAGIAEEVSVVKPKSIEDEDVKPRTKNPKCKLHIAGLAREQDSATTERKLREVFKTFGRIVKVTIIENEEGLCRGFAFIRYDSEASAESAREWAALNDAKIDGRTVNVSTAYKKAPPPPDMAEAPLGAGTVMRFSPYPVKQRKKKAEEPVAGSTRWLYKWTDAVGTDVAVHGPFGSREMENWVTSGAFENKTVWCRRADEPLADWSKVDEVPFEYFP